jgi:RNA polymerase sigma-70 factor (ECF subfamily)
MTESFSNSGDKARTKSNPDNQFKSDLCKLIPFLRAFARSLTHNVEIADDLAQEALAKAWQARRAFEPGTNLKAWLFRILRNQFYSDCRRSWRQASWDQEEAEQIPGTHDEQGWTAELSDTARALAQLADEQREALILVAAGGFSYEEAASICGCAVGTVKSRVCRARKSLLAILDGELPLSSRRARSDFGAADAILGELRRLSERSANRCAPQASP